MNPSLQSLENQYFLLRSSLASLNAQGATPDQISQLQTQIVQSRTNYWTALNKVLHDDDPAVVDLVSQMNTAQLTLAASIENLGDVAQILDGITKAVLIGSQLAAKALTL